MQRKRITSEVSGKVFKVFIRFIYMYILGFYLHLLFLVYPFAGPPPPPPPPPYVDVDVEGIYFLSP